MSKWKHRLSAINEKAKTAICAECGPVPVRLKSHLGKGTWRCRNALLKWNNNGPTNTGKKFPKEAERLLREQKGKCAICGQLKKLGLDHNHATGRLRQMLCANCNSGIGMFKDSSALLRQAARYLDKHSK